MQNGTRKPILWFLWKRQPNELNTTFKQQILRSSYPFVIFERPSEAHRLNQSGEGPHLFLCGLWGLFDSTQLEAEYSNTTALLGFTKHTRLLSKVNQPMGWLTHHRHTDT